MMDLIFGVVITVVSISLWLGWLGLGAVALILMHDHAGRAMSRIGGRYGLAWIIWPLTVLAVLLLQFNPKYRGADHDDIEYPDAFR